MLRLAGGRRRGGGGGRFGKVLLDPFSPGMIWFGTFEKLSIEGDRFFLLREVEVIEVGEMEHAIRIARLKAKGF